MPFHWLFAPGFIVTLAGWAWLALGVGLDPGIGSRAINLHMLALAEQACTLGYVVMLIGVLISGFEWLKPAPRQSPSPRGASSEEINASPLRDFAEAARKQNLKS